MLTFRLTNRQAGNLIGQTHCTMKRTILLLTLLLIGFVANTATTAEPASPSLAKDSRCFELRTYHAAPGKMEALHARFRDHTNKLFVKHGMELIGYWVASDKDQGDKLIYILAHKSRDAAKKSWQDFGNDPDWKKAHAESEVNGKLVDKVESIFMTATDYSAIK
jgi:hypothetical protein